MISSKQLIEKTGISRATMNNYIALGILPKPVVKKPEGSGDRVRSLAYFPDDAADRVKLVRRLKKEGLAMSEIAARFDAPRQALTGSGAAVTPSEPAKPAARGDRITRGEVKHSQPFLTPICVLVAEVQDSIRICAELPPEEYFELINQVWRGCEAVLRDYHVTQGKHATSGIVWCFFPRPGHNYRLNALHAAHALRRMMRALSEEWRLRKQWGGELYLNIGLNEGEEWFGTYRTTSNVEFTVLGDTINHAARLSDYARDGAVWATKNLIAKIAPEERKHIGFGIRRIDQEGREIWIPATYSRFSDLIDLGDEKYEKFRDIATLAVAEVTEIALDEGQSEPRG